MNKQIYLLFAVTCFTTTSCTKEIQCVTAPLNGFTILSDNGLITDTAANATPFFPGTHFTKPLSKSYTGRILSGDAREKKFTVDTLLWGLDWRVTLLPSGKQYRIEDIRINENRTTQRVSYLKSEKCWNSFYYTLDSLGLVSTDRTENGYLQVGY